MWRLIPAVIDWLLGERWHTHLASHWLGGKEGGKLVSNNTCGKSHFQRYPRVNHNIVWYNGVITAHVGIICGILLLKSDRFSIKDMYANYERYVRVPRAFVSYRWRCRFMFFFNHRNVDQLVGGNIINFPRFFEGKQHCCNQPMLSLGLFLLLGFGVMMKISLWNQALWYPMYESGGNKRKFFVIIPLVKQIVVPIGCVKRIQCFLPVSSFFFYKIKLVWRNHFVHRKIGALSDGAGGSAMLLLWF